MSASAWPPVGPGGSGSDGYSLFGGSGLFGGASAPSPASEAEGAPAKGSGLPTTPAAAGAAGGGTDGAGAGAEGGASAGAGAGSAKTTKSRNPWATGSNGKVAGRSTSPVFSDRSLASSSEEEPETAALRQQAKLAAAARANAENAAKEGGGKDATGGGVDAQAGEAAVAAAAAAAGGVVLTVEEIQALQHQVSTLRNEKRQLEMLLEEKVEDVPTSPRVANSQGPNPSPESDSGPVPDTFHTGPVNKAGQQQSWRNRQNEQQQSDGNGRGNNRGGRRGGGQTEGPVVQLRSGPDDDFRLDRPRGARMTEKWQKRWSTGSWGDRPYMIKARQGTYPSGRAFTESVVLNAAGVDRIRIHQTYTNLFVGCAAAITAPQLAVLKVHPDVEYVRTAARDVM